jgi:hypothetical protein
MASVIEYPGTNFLSSFTEKFSLPSHGGKAVSTYKEVIKITTNKKTLKASSEILKDLKDTIEQLPIEEKNLDLEHLKFCLDTGKKNLLEFNKFFDTIDNLFDIPNTQIDDPIMMELYSNMQTAKSELLYLIDYIQLVFEIQENKKSESLYTLDQFLNLVGVSNEIAA